MSKFKYKLPNRREQLKAMKKLLKHYLFKIDLFDCPLCDIMDYNVKHSEICRKCIWVIETKKDCQVYLREHKKKIPTDYVISLRNTRKHHWWNKMRIRQLTEWIAKYQEREV